MNEGKSTGDNCRYIDFYHQSNPDIKTLSACYNAVIYLSGRLITYHL